MRAVLACAVAASALLPRAALAQPSHDPYAIFARARAYWQNQKYPPYLTYAVAVSVNEGGTNKIERYRSAYNAVTGAIWVDPISDWEVKHPASGRGVNFFLPFGRINKPEPPVDFLGVPMLAPTFSFGMAPFVAAKPLYGLTPMQIVAEVRAAFHDPNPRAAVAASPPPSNGGLHEIADIKVFKRDYTITFVGTDAVQGHACYHLALLPTRSPHDYRLRDIWIDRATGATRKLREAINFKNGPGTDVPWTITFARIDGAQYVARERADAPMSYRGLVYAHASVAFIGVAATTALPPTMIVPATADLILNEPLKP